MSDVSLRLGALSGAVLLAAGAIAAPVRAQRRGDHACSSGRAPIARDPCAPATSSPPREQLNRMLEAAGSEDRVVIEVFENNADGFDADALDLFKAFAVDKGPDIFVAAHEWIGAFVEEGLVYQLDEHIAANPELYGDVIESLWDSVAYKGNIYGVPQDSEIRMFFYDKNMLRQIGKDEAFIEGLPAMVESGEFTIYDMTDLAKEVVDGGAAKYGIVHRPNVGPDFQMLMKSFGIDQYDAEAGKLQMSESKLAAFFEWLKYSVDQGVIPANMTAWSWDEVHASFRHRQDGVHQVPRHLERPGAARGARPGQGHLLRRDRLDA